MGFCDSKKAIWPFSFISLCKVLITDVTILQSLRTKSPKIAALSSSQSPYERALTFSEQEAQ